MPRAVCRRRARARTRVPSSSLLVLVLPVSGTVHPMIARLPLRVAHAS